MEAVDALAPRVEVLSLKFNMMGCGWVGVVKVGGVRWRCYMGERKGRKRIVGWRAVRVVGCCCRAVHYANAVVKFLVTDENVPATTSTTHETFPAKSQQIRQTYVHIGYRFDDK